MECLRWKREALEVEARLSEQRRLKILEAIQATRFRFNPSCYLVIHILHVCLMLEICIVKFIG